MNAGQRSARRIAAGNAISRDTVCSTCLQRISSNVLRRNASATATAIAEESPRTQADSSNPPVTATGLQKAFKLSCSPVISRAPQLTRNLTSFEKAFYLYQKRLNERLVLPFTRYFYIKKGTPASEEWKRKVKARRGVAARDIGAYNAYTDDGWNDEVLVGSELAEPDDIVEKIIRDAEGKDIEDAQLQGDSEAGGEALSGDTKLGEGTKKPVGEDVVERPSPRATKADAENDFRSLSRRLDRSVYLLVKNKEGRWRFPEDRLYGKENLHQAAERIIVQVGGINMHTWVVGNHPVGHYILNFSKPVVSNIKPNKMVSTSGDEFEQEEYGEKIFFMKSRILAGQAVLGKNELGDQEFQWLTKEEVKSRVDTHYWSWIKNMLTER